MNLQRRVIGLLTRPASEWRAIAAERDDVGSLYRGYIALVAAVPAASVLIGLALAGGRYLGESAITTAVMAALVSYTIALGSTIAAAVALEKLAPSFKAEADVIEALKVIAYASTPAWLAGVFSISVTLAPLVVLGWIWAVYLLYAGLPIVLKTPPAQLVPLVLVSTLTVVVVNLLLRAIASAAGLPYY